MRSLAQSLLVASILLLFHYPSSTNGFAWWFLWPTTTTEQSSESATTTVATGTDQSANGLQIAIGNRENSDTFGMDGGTNISNVEVNYARALSLLPAELARLLQFPSSGEESARSIELHSPDTWIDTILGDYFSAANESRWDRVGAMNEQLLALETYAEDVLGMLDRIRIAFGIELNRNLLTQDATVLRCATSSSLDSLARSVFEGGNDCVGQRLDAVRRAHLDASRNVSQHLVQWSEEQLRKDIRECSTNDTSSPGADADEAYELACISEILHQVHLKTLLISHTSELLTQDARTLFGTAKADVLQCAANLMGQAKENLHEIFKLVINCQGENGAVVSDDNRGTGSPI